MPNHDEHCRQSKDKYGKDFSELHTWMDNPSNILGPAHRKVRHDPWITPAEAKKLFGEMADHACLDHIKLDVEESMGMSRQGSRSSPPSGTYSLVCPYCKCRFDANLSSVMQEVSCPECSRRFQSLLARINLKKSDCLRLVTSTSDVFVPVSLEFYPPLGGVFKEGDVVILSYKAEYEGGKEPALIQNVDMNEYLILEPYHL